MTTVVPATPSPPTPAPSVDLLEPEMMRMLDQLREGSLAYTPKIEMRQGDTTAVIARISLGQPDLNLGRGLPSPAIQGLKVSRTMVATLTAVEKDAFEIRAVSDEEQIIAPPYAEWKWDVVPLRHGDHGLHLSVRAVVRADGAEKRRDYPSQDVTIHVRVNPGYLVSSFLGSNWQWLLGSPIVLGAGAWLAARLREKKRRQAGF